MRAMCFLALAALASAQAPVPEVRGTIVERGSNAPVAGAEVSLFNFGPNAENVISRKLVAKTSSGPDGTFSFKPVPLGMLTVAANKDGYQRAGEARVEVTDGVPLQTVKMSLVRPGSLTGRVVDRERNPIPGLNLEIESVPVMLGSRNEVVTDARGVFTVSTLPPASYLVHVRPWRRETDELLAYSPEAFEIVDQAVEASYWPGGATDPELALPVPVNGGGITNLGPIEVRTVPHYRVHVSLAGECGPNERWILQVNNMARRPVTDPEQYAACRKEFLVTGLAPGSYQLVVWVGRDVKAWGVAPFTITDRNVETTLTLSPTADLNGKLSAATGRELKSLGTVQIRTHSADGIPTTTPFADPDERGEFVIRGVAGRRQRIFVEPDQAGTFVKEIRYNGAPLNTYTFDFAPGGRIEIILNAGAAIVTGTAAGTGYVLLVRDGIESTEPAAFQPFQLMSEFQTGTYTVRGVPPGTYRILKVDPIAEFDLDAWPARLARAQTVTLEPNEVKSVDLK